MSEVGLGGSFSRLNFDYYVSRHQVLSLSESIVQLPSKYSHQGHVRHEKRDNTSVVHNYGSDWNLLMIHQFFFLAIKPTFPLTIFFPQFFINF